MKRRRSIAFIIILMLSAVTAFAQTFSGKVVGGDGKPLDAVSVIVTNEGNKTLAFDYTKADGSFSVNVKGEAAAISFSIIGYEKQTLLAKDFKNGQTVRLAAKDFVLKEVKVRPDKIKQAEDTLNYSVAMFQQGQDRSIADVIKNMPGLEVSQNGQISFEGKPINKFYIEGMDLMGSKYAQASENLQAKKVKTVQVVQNHQPIKSLRGVQFSDQAAINLVLKEDAKNTWARTADIGLGTSDENLLYDGRLMAMMFSKKHQNLSMYKANNTGKDITHEITELSTLLRSKQEMSGILGNITVSAPDLDNQRTNFNTSHTLANNELIRTKQGNDLRIQADWLWNRQRGDLYSETEYTDLGGVVLTEETSVSAINNRMKADLTYKINKDKTYLNNKIHGCIDFDRSYGTTILNAAIEREKSQAGLGFSEREQSRPKANGTATRLNVRPRKRYITEEFETLKTLKSGNVLNFSSQTTYSNLPGQLLTVLGYTERLDLSGIESRNTLSFRRRIKAFTVKYEAGQNIKSQRMAAEYGDVDFSETYSQQNLFLTPSVNYERGAWRMNIAAKADLMNASSLDHLRLTLQPRWNMKYDVSGTTSIQTTYSYTEAANELTTLYNTPIFTSYRTQTCCSGHFENMGSHRINLSFNYKQPIHGNFLTLEGTWQRRTNNILYQSQLVENVYLRTPTDQRYAANTYTLRAHASKSFYWAKTSVSLNATRNWSDYALLIGSSVTDWQMQSTTVQFRLTMAPAQIFSYELQNQLNSSRQKQLSKNHLPLQVTGELQGGTLTYFRHSLNLYLFPAKQWEISLKNTLYHSNDETVSLTHFTDAHISYKQKRYELRLTANNLLGKSTFERKTLSTTRNLYSIYQLRPREFLLSISIDL